MYVYQCMRYTTLYKYYQMIALFQIIDALEDVVNRRD